MKDTRKLSMIYFGISLVMLLMVCFGCEVNDTESPYVLHYQINHEQKEIDIQFSEYHTGNKAVVCQQIKDLKGLDDYSCNIQK